MIHHISILMYTFIIHRTSTINGVRGVNVKDTMTKKEEQFPDNLRMASQIKTISDTDVRCNIILQVRIDNCASGVKVKVTMTLKGKYFPDNYIWTASLT